MTVIAETQTARSDKEHLFTRFYSLPKSLINLGLVLLFGKNGFSQPQVVAEEQRSEVANSYKSTHWNAEGKIPPRQRQRRKGHHPDRTRPPRNY